MKEWNMPELIELLISETGYHLFGNSQDGGYVGDGILSGHLEWDKNNSCIPDKPEHSAKPLS